MNKLEARNFFSKAFETDVIKEDYCNDAELENGIFERLRNATLPRRTVEAVFKQGWEALIDVEKEFPYIGYSAEKARDCIEDTMHRFRVFADRDEEHPLYKAMKEQMDKYDVYTFTDILHRKVVYRVMEYMDENNKQWEKTWERKEHLVNFDSEKLHQALKELGEEFSTEKFGKEKFIGFFDKDADKVPTEITLDIIEQFRECADSHMPINKETGEILQNSSFISHMAKTVSDKAAEYVKAGKPVNEFFREEHQAFKDAKMEKTYQVIKSYLSTSIMFYGGKYIPKDLSVETKEHNRSNERN